eukprot:TRINITY_DN8572_c0_g3_i1.p1 TRINITY_DN8572_c0_g3~~TRINITY_DN8572_c0_g3_i1.p1  ORF type:complete len:356 (-),score=67.58 TRINITY_DN8572_c0_g3_i1:276-1343(-)
METFSSVDSGICMSFPSENCVKNCPLGAGAFSLDSRQRILQRANLCIKIKDRSCLVQSRALRDTAEDGDFVSENRRLMLLENAASAKLAEEGKGQMEQKKKGDLPSVVNTLMGVPGGGARAGLFRTPNSGGVQSATSAHDLPHPALAVRNLMEQARFAHLCTVMSRMHQRRKGYPFGSLVDFAPDSIGHPIFAFSPLAIHTRNLLADPRCSLVVQIPGWSGLSNARVTVFGDVYPLPDDLQDWAHQHYIKKHPEGASQKWGNFLYYRMELISDVYFIGGFGTIAWIDVKEYESVHPDKIAVDGVEQNLEELNAEFSKPLRDLLSTETEVDDVSLISIDGRGTDIRVRQGAQWACS